MFPIECNPISNKKPKPKEYGYYTGEDEEEPDNVRRSYYTRPAIRTLDEILKTDPYSIEVFKGKAMSWVKFSRLGVW